MGELFADMEKMDIQAEWQKTARERKRADQAEKHADEVQKQLKLTEENSIKSFVELCRELGASKDSAIQKLMEKKLLSLEEAREKTALYWKE